MATDDITHASVPSSKPAAPDIAEEKNKKGDPFIWSVYLILIILSIVECFSASSQKIKGSGVDMYMPIIKHIFTLVIGFVGLIFIYKVHYKWYPKLIYVFAFLTIVSMIVVLFIGEDVNNATRAFTLPIVGFSVQPAEMAKFSIVTVLALFLSRNQMRHGVTNLGVTLSALAVIIYSAFIFMQGLTNTILLMAISFSMMLIGGVQWKKIGIVILSYAVAGALFYYIKDLNDQKAENLRNNKEIVNEVTGEKMYVTISEEALEDEKGSGSRVDTWIARIVRHFNSDSLIYERVNDKNAQVIYARMAQANGGIFGVGPGNSRECSRLPLAYSDYIYSIIVEELGLIGGVFVLVVYLCLLGRAKMIAKRCARAFPALLILGMAVMITLQALIHMAINSGLSPVSGQPLPLISMGGTSALIISMAFGVMLGVSRFAVQTSKKKEVDAESKVLPEDIRAKNPYQSS